MPVLRYDLLDHPYTTDQLAAEVRAVEHAKQHATVQIWYKGNFLGNNPTSSQLWRQLNYCTSKGHLSGTSLATTPQNNT